MGEAFSFLYEHITDEHHREHLSETYGVGSPGNNDGDPHGAYMYLMAECDVLPNRDGEEEQDIEWLQFGIAKNVGKHENTIKEMLKILRSMNIPRSALRKKTSDEIAEKILRCIYAATNDAIGTEASRELEAVQGVPGQPGVRMFQHHQLQGAPAGNTRDLTRLVRHFHEGWSKAIKAGHIATCKATMHQSRANMMVELGRSAAVEPEYQETEASALERMYLAGAPVEKGNTTTSRLGGVSEHELALAMRGESAECEVCFQADGDNVRSFEIICNNCKGMGHIAKDCSSHKQPRSIEYAISALQSAKEASLRRGPRDGRYQGQRRPMQRGQRPPFSNAAAPRGETPRTIPTGFRNSSTPASRYRRHPARASARGGLRGG